MRRKAVLLAESQRDNIDKDLEGIMNYLEGTKMGYKKPLVDKEGFPLPGIDIATILAKRQRASRLLNDRKRYEHIIEELLATHTDDSQPILSTTLENLHVFSMVSEIHINSPAEKAGLREGDFLISFGNAKSLMNIKENITEGVGVKLVIYRVDEYEASQYELDLIPAKWDGAGLVGCHLLPL